MKIKCKTLKNYKYFNQFKNFGKNSPKKSTEKKFFITYISNTFDFL